MREFNQHVDDRFKNKNIGCNPKNTFLGTEIVLLRIAPILAQFVKDRNLIIMSLLSFDHSEFVSVQLRGHLRANDLFLPLPCFETTI